MELFLDVDANTFTMTERAVQGFALLILLAIIFYMRKLFIHFVWKLIRRLKKKMRGNQRNLKKEPSQPELLSDYFDESGERHGSNIFTNKSNDKN